MTHALTRHPIQSEPRQMVTLQLTAMQLPEANPVAQEATWGTGDSDTSGLCRLRLNPGATSELMVQVRNVSDRPLALTLVVTGDFPTAWQQIHLPVTTLASREQTDGSVYFALDAQFFENPFALHPQGRRHLTLDYQGQVSVYASRGENADGENADGNSAGHDRADGAIATTTQHLLASADFSLHLRPPSEYPQLLPAVYQDIDFINRFLTIFEQAFDPAVQTLSTLWAYLDPLTAPEAMLPFLAQWTGWSGNVPLSWGQQRRLIRHALSIYRWRGTRWGLLLYLHLYTGLPLSLADLPPTEDDLRSALVFEPEDWPDDLRHIRVDQDSIEGFVVGATDLGPDAMLGGGRPYHFTVRLRSPVRLDEGLVRQIIDQEKPAFCVYALHILYYDRTAPYQ